MNKKFDFSWEFNNFAIRTKHEEWGDVRRRWPIELVKYLDDTHNSCYVVAAWRLDDEGYDLHFIGNRPFKDISPEDIAVIWKQLQAAQTMLDAFFEANEEE